ncbi:hypothetical protein JRQ81_008714 [Phrynocephalus forsythii]|uniref:Long-chain-fatty-acid--CoA ligase ACSBG2 n=1 Tax=Phrynocephalus forsythii TaxID=171643 RepID=A0A9Q1ASP6_9SAUR|nr:hypothetical protein JRQ81_008714 [Phrynocephalus forsythii]
MALGSQVPDELLDKIIESQKPNQCCTLIYTSGTTGTPKGVMLSHDNITWTARAGGEFVSLSKATERQEVVVSYLPLSHVAAQMIDIWLPIAFGVQTCFAQPDALKGSLVETLREVRPTAFLGVPRVWEKMQERMKAVGAKSSALKRRIAAWAKAVGMETNLKRLKGSTDLPFNYRLARSLVYKKVHKALGLDRCTKCYTGAAPIARDTLEFFLSLDLPIYELYGMSESTGPHTVSHPKAHRLTSHPPTPFAFGIEHPEGSPLICDGKFLVFKQGDAEHLAWRLIYDGKFLALKQGDAEVRFLRLSQPGLALKTSLTDGLREGDHRMQDDAVPAGPGRRGRGVLLRAARFHGLPQHGGEDERSPRQRGLAPFGDLGKHDAEGFLYITGRIKELIITAGGENIPPVPIEDAVKEAVPILSNVMLVGDKAKFLSMLVTLKCKMNPDSGEPEDELTPEVVEFCRKVGSRANKVSDVVSVRDPAVYAAIQKGINAVNEQATSNAQKIQKWVLLDKDFSVAGGELGPTMKLKRPTVLEMYKRQIAEMYAET